VGRVDQLAVDWVVTSSVIRPLKRAVWPGRERSCAIEKINNNSGREGWCVGAELCETIGESTVGSK
jgi:hypothetical protein